MKLKFIKKPEKLYQPYNGFKFEFFQHQKRCNAVINNTCFICGGEIQIKDNGYEDKTDISTTCKFCGNYQSRYIKYHPYSEPTSYEFCSVVIDNIEFFNNKDGYLTIYNILWQDEKVVFELVEDEKRYCFEKSFDELEEFYKKILKT